jgi:hypothetical protein
MIFQARMIRNFVFLALAIFAVSTRLQAQGFYDTAPRFGQNSIFGSTKSMGMGGVQMGVGGEGAALGVNPAAPGLLRKSEVQLSLMPYLNTTNSTFRDGTVSADKSGMPLGSFSLSLTSLKTEDEENPIRAGVFTVSYNRVSVFHRKTVWEGETPLYQNNSSQPTNNSIIDLYLAGANKPGTYPSQTILEDANGDPIVFSDNFKNDLVLVGIQNSEKIHSIRFWTQKQMSETFAIRYFEEIGHEVLTCKSFQGQFVKHEVDVIGAINNQRFFVECKFHNHQGIKNDVKISLYVKARWDDLKGGVEGKNLAGYYVASNTAFTLDAITYANGTGLKLLGVNSPSEYSFFQQIKMLKLFPLTSLRSLNRYQKRELLKRNLVLAKEIPKNKSLLYKLGITERTIQSLLDEVQILTGEKS